MTLEITFKVLGFSALLIFLLGSFFDRMVGVELLNSLQLIFLLHFTVDYYTSVIGSLQQLSEVCLSFLF